MAEKTHSRGHFSSSIGFILAATGSAVGLGNLWKFPYIAGTSGGGFFLLFYLIFTALLGIPLLLTETTIGRKTGLNAVGSFQKLNKSWTFVGIIGVCCAFIVLSYYSVVGGWVLKYFLSYVTGNNITENSKQYFENFISSPIEPIVWHLIFMTTAAFIIVGGVSKGIEKVSKIMLPGLFILIIIIAIRSLTLDGASKGIEFLFKPHKSQFNNFKDILKVMALALGQVFFSLSIGMGIGITYGSYLKKDSNLPKNSLIIAGLDSLVAILAGVAILPAVFSYGFEPTSGPGLIFQTIPAVFADMPFGRIFGALFFLLVFFAAITSAISSLEVVTAYFIDKFKMKRKTATILIASAIAFVGVFASLSMGSLNDIKIFNMNFFDFESFVTDKLLMPLGGILTSIFIGHIYKVKNIKDEIEAGIPSGKFKYLSIYEFLLKWIIPVLIFIIFIFEFI